MPKLSLMECAKRRGVELRQRRHEREEAGRRSKESKSSWCRGAEQQAESTHGASDMHGAGVFQRVEVPPLLAHDVSDLVDVAPRIVGRKRDDRRRWVAQHVQLSAKFSLDACSNGLRSTDDFAA